MSAAFGHTTSCTLPLRRRCCSAFLCCESQPLLCRHAGDLKVCQGLPERVGGMR
eukprot:COSAG05_NODE_13874_length_415_cov_1.101266_1_plen_53_part_01